MLDEVQNLREVYNKVECDLTQPEELDLQQDRFGFQRHYTAWLTYISPGTPVCLPELTFHCRSNEILWGPWPYQKIKMSEWRLQRSMIKKCLSMYFPELFQNGIFYTISCILSSEKPIYLRQDSWLAWAEVIEHHTFSCNWQEESEIHQNNSEY